jgi:tripartite-type tricarboxylate transporter receptor subunit TctC
MTKLKLGVWFLIIAAGLLPTLAYAQAAYPSKPVKIIVPFAPGGASDFVGRVLQPRLAELLGQQIIIENRAGAAGNIGMEAAAKSAPDGYTLYLGNVGTIAINPSVFTNLTVNPLKAFHPVTLVSDVPGVLIVHPSVPAKSAKEFAAYAKANPGKLNFGSPGSGSQNRLEMELFKKNEGLDMVHVPYKGGAGQAVAGVVSGEISVMFTTLASAMSLVQSGRVNALAVTSPQRVKQLPSVPTMVESGYAYSVSSSWQGIFVPTGTPKPIIDRLFTVFAEVLKTPDVVERLAKGGADVAISASPQEFAKFAAAENERWGKVAKEAKVTAD